MGFPALPFIPFTGSQWELSLVPGAELDMKEVVEEEDPSPEERGGLSPLPVGLEEPFCCVWAGQDPSAHSPCFPSCHFFLCPIMKVTDGAVVLETVATAISLV